MKENRVLVKLFKKDAGQKIYIHKSSARSFEIRLFKEGGRLQTFRGKELTGENVIVNLTFQTQEQLQALLIRYMDFDKETTIELEQA